MAWYNATGKENDKSLYENNRIVTDVSSADNTKKLKLL